VGVGWGLWDWIRGKGGNPDEEADLREEFGGEDPGEAEERYLRDSAYGEPDAYPGIAGADAAAAAEADLEDTRPPRDPAP
jgi:hypothetical protein